MGQKMIVSNWGFVPALEDADRRKLKADPRVFDNFNFGERSSLDMAVRTTSGLWAVPRAYFQGKPCRDETYSSDPIVVRSSVKLKPEQKKPLDEVMAHYRQRHFGCILVAPCGAGKTVMGIKFIEMVKRETLILVHRTDLLKQWCDQIKKFAGLTAGVIAEETCELKPITVAMIQTVLSRGYEFKDRFEVIISDECQHLSSDTWSKVITRTYGGFRLGLTATPIRPDGMSKVFEYHTGPYVNMERQQTAIEKVCYKVKYTMPFPMTPKYHFFGGVNSNKVSYVLMRIQKTLSRVDSRNKLIMSIVSECVKRQRRVLVLTHLIEHINLLQECCQANGFNSGVYRSGVTKEEVYHKQVINATYSKAKEGLDIPELDTLIIATPISDVEQAVGRILRVMKGKRALVFDLVDNWKLMGSFWNKREACYLRLGFSVKLAKIDFS